MKIFVSFCMTFFICFTMLSFFAPARAGAFFDIEPQGNTVKSQGETAAFDLFFTSAEPSGGPTIVGWELDFFFDDTELAYVDTFYVDGFQDFPSPPVVTENNVYNATISFSPFSFEYNTKTLIATHVFTVVGNNLFDGLEDFQLQSQIGVTARGLTDESAFFHQYDGASGADVGIHPVPLPGALILFATGFAGLLGVRKKMNS